MKNSLIASALILSATTALGATKSYQVTGPVTAVDDSSITVQKGKESWQIEKEASAGADVKKGDKVTVSYKMTATKIEGKAAKK